MAQADEAPVTIQELLVSSLAQTDALAKLLIEKGFITADIESNSALDYPASPGNSH
jgi:hypothetical protein